MPSSDYRLSRHACSIWTASSSTLRTCTLQLSTPFFPDMADRQCPGPSRHSFRDARILRYASHAPCLIDFMTTSLLTLFIRPPKFSLNGPRSLSLSKNTQRKLPRFSKGSSLPALPSQVPCSSYPIYPAPHRLPILSISPSLPPRQ